MYQVPDVDLDQNSLDSWIVIDFNHAMRMQAGSYIYINLIASSDIIIPVPDHHSVCLLSNHQRLIAQSWKNCPDHYHHCCLWQRISHCLHAYIKILYHRPV